MVDRADGTEHLRPDLFDLIQFCVSMISRVVNFKMFNHDYYQA